MHMTEHNTGIKDYLGREIHLGDAVVLTQSSEAYSWSSRFAFVTRVGNKPTGYNAPDGRLEITRISSYNGEIQFFSSYVDNTSIVVVNETLKEVCKEFDQQFELVKAKINTEKAEAKNKNEYYILPKENKGESIDYVVIKVSGKNAEELRKNLVKEYSKHKGFCSGYSLKYNKRNSSFELKYGLDALPITLIKKVGFTDDMIDQVITQESHPDFYEQIKPTNYVHRGFQYEHNTIK